MYKHRACPRTHGYHFTPCPRHQARPLAARPRYPRYPHARPCLCPHPRRRPLSLHFGPRLTAGAPTDVGLDCFDPLLA